MLAGESACDVALPVGPYERPPTPTQPAPTPSGGGCLGSGCGCLKTWLSELGAFRFYEQRNTRNCCRHRVRDPIRTRSFPPRGRLARQTVHHRRARRDSRWLRCPRDDDRSRLRARREGSGRGDGSRWRDVFMSCRFCGPGQRHCGARARLRRYAAFFVTRPHLRTAHTPDDSTPGGEPGRGRTPRCIRTPVPRGISRRLRSRMQDGRSDQSNPLSKRLSFLGNVRHVRGDGQRRQAPRARRRVARERARDRVEHELGYPVELRHHDQAAARGACGAERGDCRRTRSRRSHRRQGSTGQPVGLLPGLYARSRVRREPDCRRARKSSQHRIARRIAQAVPVRQPRPSKHGRNAEARY